MRKIYYTFASAIARIAQLVEHDLAKVGVAGSSPVSRSIFFERPICCPDGGIGRRAGLKILCPVVDVPVRCRLRVQKLSNLGAFCFLFLNSFRKAHRQVICKITGIFNPYFQPIMILAW